MEFPGFLGNEQLKCNLSAAVDRQRAAHFYLLSGPEGSGKRTLARLLTAALLCRSEGAKPCGICNQCRKALNNQHPDLITVDDTEHKNIPVKLVRSAREDLFIRPNEGNRKIYYVPKAQNLNLEGQNALLKVLEEPPAYGVFLLLTDNPDKLLPTVRSRCVELKLQPLPVDVVERELQKEFPDSTQETRVAAANRSGGWLGQAKTLMQEGGGWYPQTIEFVESYCTKNHQRLLRLLVPMEKMKREQVAPILSQWRDLLSSALTCRAGLPPMDPFSRQLAMGRTSKDLTHGVETLQKSLEYLQGNISVGAICGNLVWQLR